MHIVLGCIQKIDNAVVKKQQEEAPPYNPSFCLVTNNLLGLERSVILRAISLLLLSCTGITAVTGSLKVIKTKMILSQ